MSSYQYRKSHRWDKTVVRSSYLHNGIFYTGKMSSLYWTRALVSRARTNKYVHGYVISSHTLLGMWFIIYAFITHFIGYVIYYLCFHHTLYWVCDLLVMLSITHFTGYVISNLCFHHTLDWVCAILSMLSLKLIHVSKRCPRCPLTSVFIPVLHTWSIIPVSPPAGSQ